MNRLKASYLLLAVFLVFAWATIASGEVLKVATDATFAPFEFVDDVTKQPAGFDVDLIYAIGEAMGMKVEVINTAWDGLITGLRAGHHDAVIAAMAITEERQMSVDFSDPYFITGQVVVVKPGNSTIRSYADLSGKSVGVQIGTTGHFAAEEIRGARVMPFNTAPDAFLALKMGQVQAVVVDELVAFEELKANPGQTQIVGEVFAPEEYGIAIRTGQKSLLERINKALDEIKANGTYDRIYAKWITEAN